MTTDESFTWRLIHYSWAEMAERTANDVHPPLHYVVAKAWGAVFGTSLFSLRMHSLVLSSVAVVLMYWIARTSLARLSVGPLASEAGGLLAALALALHPLQVEIGSTGRMYPLGVLLALVSTLCLREIQFQPDRRRLYAALYGLSAAALCYTHNYGLLVVAAQAAYAAAFYGRAENDQQRAIRRALLGAFLLVGAIYLPWVAATTRQMATLTRGYWIDDLTFAHATDLLAAWLSGNSSGIRVRPMPLDERVFGLVVLGGIVAGALARGSRFHIQLLSESFGPWVAVILVYIAVGQNFALPRCFTFALASLILLATLLIPLVPSVFGRAVFTSACFLPMLWYGAEAIWVQEPEWDDKAAAIDVTAEHWQTGDVLVVRQINGVNILLYHAKAAGINDFDVRCLVGPFKDRQEHWVHVASLDEENELITSLSALTPGKFGRVWILGKYQLPHEEDLTLWRQRRTWRLADGSSLVLYQPAEASEVTDHASKQV